MPRPRCCPPFPNPPHRRRCGNCRCRRRFRCCGLHCRYRCHRRRIAVAKFVVFVASSWSPCCHRGRSHLTAITVVASSLLAACVSTAHPAGAASLSFLRARGVALAPRQWRGLGSTWSRDFRVGGDVDVVGVVPGRLCSVHPMSACCGLGRNDTHFFFVALRGGTAGGVL